MKQTSNKPSNFIAISVLCLFLTNAFAPLFGKNFSLLSNLKFIFGFALVLLILCIRKTVCKRLSELSMSLFYIFICLTLYFGETFGLYWRWYHYDSLLHVYSGALITLIAFEVLTPYFLKTKIQQRLLRVLSGTLSMTFGVFWEFYEYIGDGLMNLNMQRYMNLEGRAILVDTIKDLWCNLGGIVLIMTFLYFNTKKNRLTESQKSL